jgi:undecaprenyl diphosphate synthase
MAANATPPNADAQTGGPLHVAIVMDGNGRWAKKRGLPRTLGHRAGVEALKRTVSAAPKLGIGWLTVFGFSTENWSRPAAEVSELMALPKRYFESDLARLEREGVRVRVLGRRRPEDMDEAMFASLLATSGSPPPDLIVRPSGEQRLSNFLLWEAAYAEFVFQDVLWPDYGEDHLRAALQVFAGRDRRYGAVTADDVLAAG